MKKKKKAYFSKTFIYLVLLIATVAGFFLMVNYATNQKLSLNSDAAPKLNKCQAFKKTNYNSCDLIKDKRKFTACEPGHKKDNKYIYCRAQNMEDAKNNRGKNCRQAGGTDWYRSYQSIIDGYNSKYTVTVTNKSYDVGQFYRDQAGYPKKQCFKVIAKLKPTCPSLGGGVWMNSCSLTNGYYYNYTNPNRENLADYKQGKVCCKKGSKKVVEPKPEPQ